MTETFISYTVKNENGKPLQIQEKSAILCKSRIADLEQVRGVEPPYSAWEADVLPMNYTCVFAKMPLPAERAELRLIQWTLL